MAKILKKRLVLLLIAVITIVSITACSGDKSGNKGGNESENKSENETENKSENETESKSENETKNKSGNKGGNVDTTEDKKIFDALFDLNNKVSIDVDISDSELKKMQQDFARYDQLENKSPIYRIADKVTITIGDKSYELEEVGIRIKGNTGRDPVWDNESGNFNLTHYRLSFNETFDDETYYGADAKVWASDEERQVRKDRRFATLKSLELKWNRNYDNTYVREYYAYTMFRENGILAAHTGLSQIIVQNENRGVYCIYEPIDKIFIEKNLPEKDWDGDLYKSGWTYSPANYTNMVTYGIEDEDTGLKFNFDLKTNRTSSEHESLINLLEVLNGKDVTQKQFESVVDTDYLAKFFALSYFTGNPDDIRNNYNNHYVYFLGSTGKAVFLPYDYDRCLGITCGWNPDGSGMTAASPFSERAEGNYSRQSNPLISNSIFEDEFLFEKYKEELAILADSEWLTEEKFKSYYELAKANYENVCKPEYDFANADEERFYFSLDGTYTAGEEENMSVAEYFERILNTYKEAIGK